MAAGAVRPRLTVSISFVITLALAQLTAGRCRALNADGSSLSDTQWQCDAGALASASSTVFSSPQKYSVDLLAGVFHSHRWTATGDLMYKIPVPDGTAVNVELLFMETWKESAAGRRMFTVSINDVRVNSDGVNKGVLDVFESIKGIGKPLCINAGRHRAKNGTIIVRLGRIAGKNNPMISGIALQGNSVDVKISVFSCAEVGPSKVLSIRRLDNDDKTATERAPALKAEAHSPRNSSDRCVHLDSETDTNFTIEHDAHAVTGGTYTKTDYKKKGFATVTLDGLRSHSHYQSGNISGEIVSYRWTWVDKTHPAADRNGLVTVTSGKSQQNFSIGETQLKLEVADQLCNTAVKKTTVVIYSATKPGAYCYYYDLGESSPATVQLHPSPAEGRKPQYARDVSDIDFGTTDDFGKLPFIDNSFAVRCMFSIDVPTAAAISYNVAHNGPITIYNDGKLVASSDSKKANVTTLIPSRMFGAGSHEWQIVYIRPKAIEGTLKFQFSNRKPVPTETVRYDAGSVLPVITSISSSSGHPEEELIITGSGLVNCPMVMFGIALAETVESESDSLTINVPPGNGTVKVTVKTEAGVSNSVDFTYEEPSVCSVPRFTNSTIQNADGSDLKIRGIAVLRYGPDGRLYLGSTNSEIVALTLDKDLKVTKECRKNIAGADHQRWVLGLAFNPRSSKIKLFFTSNTFRWRTNNFLPFEKGWTNGKVQSVTLSGANACFNDDVTDVVTGLPVTSRDHGNNFLQFLRTGEMIIGVGGFTNGGIPDKNLGGDPSNSLSGAIVQCPESGAVIKHSNLTNPEESIATGGCSVYASGFRNTFASELHTNGHLYATDNGSNEGFGNFMIDCQGTSIPSKDRPDKLHKVQRGKCHGHPNLTRGRRGAPAECAFEDARCVKPLFNKLQPSTNGVLEYRANLFEGKLKGNLFLAKFSDTSGKSGRLTRVQLDNDGDLTSNGVTNSFFADSGLSIVQGPRGEMIMSRVKKSSILVLHPVCDKPDATYLIAVHPNRGPASGGHRVLVSGFRFGTTPTAQFGERECTDVVVINNDSFTCVTPPGKPNDQVKVVVEGKTGENFPTKGSDYWYW